jgi:hypothetical protein
VVGGDFNGDGLADLVFANRTFSNISDNRPEYGEWSAANRLCIAPGNSGDEWTCQDIASIEDEALAVSVADLDADGNLDLVFGNELPDANGWLLPERAEVCLGDGNGSFSCSPIDSTTEQIHGPGFSTGVESVSVADIDLDGSLDLVLAESGTANEVCLGDGDGAFSCLSAEPEGARTFEAAVGDLNSDGLADLFFANNGTPNRLCLAESDDTFVCVDVSTAQNLGTAATAADMNQDGHLDVLLGRGDNDVPPDDNADQLCLGDGTGNLECSSLPTKDVITWDIFPFGDGYISVGGSNHHLYVCQADGEGFSCQGLRVEEFVDDRGFAIPIQLVGMAVLETSSAGTEISFVIANRDGPNPECRYSIPASLGPDPRHAPIGPVCVAIDGEYASTAVAVADFNSDGEQDFAFAAGLIDESGPEDMPNDRVCLASREGYDCSDLPGGEVDASAIAAGDLDGDGNVDLVVGHEHHDGVDGEPLYVRACVGDGGGGFDCGPLYVGEPTGGGPSVIGLELVDVDADSDLDVIVANDSIENALCRNEGGSVFVCTAIEPEKARTHDLGVGDFDGDGSVDIYFVNQPTPNRLCLNDGTGSFECIDATEPNNSSLSVGVVDVDGDGVLDVVLGRDDSTSSLDIPNEDVDQICLGDGSGGFACSDFENIQEFPVSIEPIDQGLLTAGFHPVLCIPDGTTFACHRMDDPNRPLMADERGFDLFPMWFMDIALVP